MAISPGRNLILFAFLLIRIEQLFSRCKKLCQPAVKKIDFKTIIDNKNSRSEKIRLGMEGLLQNNGVEVIAGHAVFEKTDEAFWVIFVFGK
jgi:pyruvate/2-oxoglutarate dehydrogenase complex dihydrolipoamide dehydrogenase (E3) component